MVAGKWSQIPLDREWGCEQTWCRFMKISDIFAFQEKFFVLEDNIGRRFPRLTAEEETSK